jgi:hypothetical protein
MIWVEILSRQREVAERFRVAGPEVRIGRGYDNDVIVDDPYVAANHLRVFRDEDGQLVAEDMGSANGTFLNEAKGRLERFIIDGNHPIRIGQTRLRIRDLNYAVLRERIASPERPTLPIVLAVVFGIAVLGISTLRIWLGETAEPRASSYLALLTLIVIVLGWAGMWALLSRIFSGHSSFPRHVLIVLAGIFALLLYGEWAQFSAFSLTWPAVGIYEYVAVWSSLAAICFLHLREVTASRLWLKGAIIATLLATGITAQTLQQSEAFSDVGRQNTAHLLMPPWLRVAPIRDQGVFFQEIADLKSKLDRDRSQAKGASTGH